MAAAIHAKTPTAATQAASDDAASLTRSVCFSDAAISGTVHTVIKGPRRIDE